ncbi:hypothetical protein C2U72_06165 [Prosthecomicrobium hirschii]|uniref:hypothetical protein n=1 Tax=Prosthecodimorpha hirschii TaxID=665126 RepID=UPI001126BF7E|nr:hypothetical protein [Prosthecomicrobium hirschii]TPQ51884.1 hypothetical protein C2U72_06165 [Prosthecomicrobium hirschii]
MTPTLFGRLQTRLALYLLIGLPVTLVIAFRASGWSWPPAAEPCWFIATLFALGLVLEPVYFQMQRFRWDQDWPFAFFAFFSVMEFLAVYAAMRLDWLPYLPACLQSRLDPARQVLVCQLPSLTLAEAAAHFALVFVPMLIALLAGLQIFMVRWRYRGGQFGRFPVID